MNELEYTKYENVVLYAKDNGFRLTIEKNRSQYIIISWYYAYTRKEWYKGAMVYRTKPEQVEQTCNYILQSKQNNTEQ